MPDYRSIPIGIHYSLLELPATPMRPRLADDRVGYFVSATKDFSRDTAESFFVRYVNRWRLEKKNPGAGLSEPVQPITYYIDRTVPVEWRPFVRAGILEWNRAFEDAGFRDAIRVLDAPDDSAWSAADARYSTVRWTANNGAVYAIGPTNVDPRTGEILNADILDLGGLDSAVARPVGPVRRARGRGPVGAAGRFARAGRGRRVATLPLWRGDDAQRGARDRGDGGAGEIPAGGEASGCTSGRRSRPWSCTRSGTRSACATISAAPPARTPRSSPTGAGPPRTASACR